MIDAGFAPAKVNLFLHVGPLRPDGFHPISSLMVFADVGDRLTAEPAARFGMAVAGPFAGEVPPGEDNLVLRAARALLDRCGAAEPALRLVLDKQLPPRRGLAAGPRTPRCLPCACLRGELGLNASDATLEAIAAGLGSDIPACVAGRPTLAQGRGERLSPGPAMPDLPAVLVRPPEPSATGPRLPAPTTPARRPRPNRRPLPAAFARRMSRRPSSPNAATTWRRPP